MSKEINIDEILTRSKKQAEQRKEKKKSSVVLDGETGEEVNTASSEKKVTSKKEKSSAESGSPFSGMFGGGNATGMPGNFSDIFNDPRVVDAISSGKLPGFDKLPLKQRIMFKLMRLFGTTQGKKYLRKRWWPVWAVGLLLLGSVGLVVGVFYLLFLLLKMIFTPYIEIFKPKR